MGDNAILAGAKRAIYSLGLARRFYQARAALRGGGDQPPADEFGMPIPPRDLIELVVGDIGWRAFLAKGEKHARAFAGAVDRNGGDFRAARRVLDFGCGAGRLARHLPKLTDAEIYGVDYNRDLARWCAENLAGTFSANRLAPPLDFPDGHFDIIYLLSVFTHLRIATQDEWLAEFARVLGPGGFALVTFHDEDHPALAAAGRTSEDLRREGAFVHNDAAEGSNFIATFQSRDYMRAQAGKLFDVAEIVPTGDSGLGQALAVLRRL